jgi:predicted transcriptional regulator
MQVLGLLEPGVGLSVAAVRARLRATGADLAYTTVMTVLVRLHAKGLVARARDKNRFLYQPAKRAARVSTGILTRIQRKLFAGDRAKPILALLDDARISTEELEDVRRFIDAKIAERKP